MYYFPVHLLMNLERYIKEEKRAVVLCGTFKDDMPDITNFELCKIDRSKICGQYPSMTVYLKPIEHLEVSAFESFNLSSRIKDRHLLLRDGTFADLRIVLKGDICIKHRGHYVDIVKTIWLRPEGEQFYLLLCHDTTHPSVMKFGVVAQEWVDRYVVPKVDSK